MVGHNRNEVGSSEHDRESGKKHAEMAPKSVRLTRRLMIVLDVLDITAVMLFLVVIQFQVHWNAGVINWFWLLTAPVFLFLFFNYQTNKL